MAMMESLEGELAFKKLGAQIQLSVFCPGLVATSLWDVEKVEAQRPEAERRTVKAKASQKKFFDTLGTPVSDAITCYIDDVKKGRFICDSAVDQVKATFQRRAEYISGGLMPSDRRARM
jgi:short-subunit dehydrogenase